MPNTTSRLALQEPVGTDTPSELRTAITNHATTLDNAVTFSQGTLASRPTPSLAGRLYFATDTGLFYQDTGSVWTTTAQLDTNGHIPLPNLSGITGSQLASTVNTTIGNGTGATLSTDSSGDAVIHSSAGSKVQANGDGSVYAVSSGGTTYVITDNAGNSGFVQNCGGLKKLAIDGGAYTAAAVGSSSWTYTVSHSLGRVPTSATATTNTWGLITAVTNFTSTTIDVRVQNSAGTNLTGCQIYWQVMG